MVWNQHQIFDNFSCLTYLKVIAQISIENRKPVSEKPTPIFSAQEINLNWTPNKYVQQMLSLLPFLPGKYRQILSLGGAKAFLKTFCLFGNRTRLAPVFDTSGVCFRRLELLRTWTHLIHSNSGQYVLRIIGKMPETQNYLIMLSRTTNSCFFELSTR